MYSDSELLQYSAPAVQQELEYELEPSCTVHSTQCVRRLRAATITKITATRLKLPYCFQVAQISMHFWLQEITP